MIMNGRVYYQRPWFCFLFDQFSEPDSGRVKHLDLSGIKQDVSNIQSAGRGHTNKQSQRSYSLPFTLLPKPGE